jgi:MFS family permease
MSLLRHKTRLFHGWYVLVASFIVLFLSGGSRAAIGVMVKPMEVDLGWTREAISSTMFLNLGIYALATLVTGRLYDRYGPKWIIVVSTLLFSAGHTLMATMGDLWQLYLYFGVLNALGLAGITVTLFGTLVGKWFEEWRGLCITLAFAGTCIGQFLLVPFLSEMTATSGWRAANLWIASVCLVVNLALTFGVIRGEPKDYGLEPYGRHYRGTLDLGSSVGGMTAVKDEAPTKSKLSVAAPRDLTLSEAMRSRSLWLFAIALFACGSADFLVTLHLVPMVRDHGLTEGVAASMLAWLGLLSLPGMLIAGPIAKAVGNKMPIAATFVMRLALFVMLLFVQGPITFWIFSLGFGLTLLVAAPLTTTLIGELYGVRHLGFITGFVNTIHTIGGGVGAYLGGVVFQRTDGYNAAFIASAVFAAVAAVCSILIREKRHLPPEHLAGGAPSS